MTDPLILPALTQNSRLIYSPAGLNLSANPIDFTDTSMFGGTAAAEISGMTFTGSIDAPATAPGSYVQAGSFDRDQLSMVTIDGFPATLAFDFQIDYDLTLSGGYGAFYYAMGNTWATQRTRGSPWPCTPRTRSS